MNVVLADRTKAETKKQSRNGLGKSSLIEVIHFCLGADYAKGPLSPDELKGWTFSLDLTLAGKPVSVSRNTSSNRTVTIDGTTSGWPIEPEVNKRTGERELSVRNWTPVLGALMFGLPVQETQKYRPQFRGLVPYFARRGKDAYSTPFEHHRKQKQADIQVFNSFLLGLESEDAAEFQRLKDRKTQLQQLKKMGSDGTLGKFIGSLGELEALKVRLETQVEREAEQLASFRVHPQYDDIANRANTLTSEIHAIANDNVVNKRLLELYRKSVQDEQAPPTANVSKLYEQAGVDLPGLVRQRLSDVERFHDTLLANRRSFLGSEMRRLSNDIAKRALPIEARSTERASLMAILQTHGALDEYTRLQQLHLQTSSRLEDVEQRIGILQQLAEGLSALKIDQELLLQRARRDLAERSTVRDKAIQFFNSNSEALYQAPGNLVINVEENGFRFGVEIERSGSQGTNNMKVFCYDLMLAQLWATKSPTPGFLIHDSTIFDGVDERQVALALELAERKSRESGFQYLCTLNSDTLPLDDFSSGFNIHDFVRLTLSDTDDSARLFGIRF